MAQLHRIIADVLQGMPLLEWTYAPHEWEAIARTRAAARKRGAAEPAIPTTTGNLIVDRLRNAAYLEAAALNPEVLFTTTGFLFADTARLWSTRCRRLSRAQVYDGLPGELELSFTSVLGLLRNTVSIPIPEGLTDDVVHLAARVLQIAQPRAMLPPPAIKTRLG